MNRYDKTIKDLFKCFSEDMSLKVGRGCGKSGPRYVWEAYEGAWLEVEAERVRDLWLSGYDNLAWRVYETSSI